MSPPPLPGMLSEIRLQGGHGYSIHRASQGPQRDCGLRIADWEAGASGGKAGKLSVCVSMDNMDGMDSMDAIRGSQTPVPPAR